MKDLDHELWQLGVLAKTEHNEVAPAQHELAPIYTTTNGAVDSNLLTMELMKKVAERHGLVCLLHEKPFAGVNGSGKHNNWSLSTPTMNLLDPGKTPMENLQFLIFLAAVIKAVDEYQDLLRASVASAGNDHRLGANEAPPAIISIFVGDELSAIIDALADDVAYTCPERVSMDLGVAVLPKFTKDNTDRNRTSPFAFTGNKFEFRMPGSNMNIADANIVLNTAVAKELKEFADTLETAEDFSAAAMDLVKATLKAHKDIIFNGNGYSEEWEQEAERRGLFNLKSTVDALPVLLSEKNVALFELFGVLCPHHPHGKPRTRRRRLLGLAPDEYAAKPRRCRSLDPEEHLFGREPTVGERRRERDTPCRTPHGTQFPLYILHRAAAQGKSARKQYELLRALPDRLLCLVLFHGGKRIPRAAD